MRPRTYTIRSESGAFEDFEYYDDGLGYLHFTLCHDIIPPKVADYPATPPETRAMIGLGRWCYPRKDLLVQPKGEDDWYRIYFRPNSSMTYLCSKTQTINLHPCDSHSERRNKKPH